MIVKDLNHLKLNQTITLLDGRVLGYAESGDLDDDICINAVKNEFKHIILNLLNNSKDAFIRNNIQNRKINIFVSISADGKVIQIEDNAGGIDKDIKDKVFEPYIPIKEEKIITDIGIYISKIILNKHCEGTITVEDNRIGTCFKIKIKDL